MFSRLVNFPRSTFSHCLEPRGHVQLAKNHTHGWEGAAVLQLEPHGREGATVLQLEPQLRVQ